MLQPRDLDVKSVERDGGTRRATVCAGARSNDENDENARLGDFPRRAT